MEYANAGATQATRSCMSRRHKYIDPFWKTDPSVDEIYIDLTFVAFVEATCLLEK